MPPRCLPWLGFALLLPAIPLLTGCDQDGATTGRPPGRETALSVPDLLRGGLISGGDEAGYARALAPRPFVFPGDHGPHPDYRTEWWYWTGNLETPEGRRFGYQWVLFRLALHPRPPPRASAWGTTQIYMAHLALTDVAGGGFRYFERFARGAAGLAGAQAGPLRLWLEDWSLAAQEDGAWRLRAAAEDVALDLRLTALKPVVLHGERGLSRKGPAPGNATYYYSITRLETRGGVTLGGRRFPVRGQSWLDREWGTSALGRDQQGWDWFALQLDDGSEVMYYRLRRRDGTAGPFSGGTRVDPAGRATALAPCEVTLDILDTWDSPSGARYPARWRMRVHPADLTLEIQPVLPDQELDVSVRYWEGAVDVRGRRGGRTLTGRGYVELVGYGPAAAAGPEDGGD